MGYTQHWSFTRNPKDIENGAAKFKNAVELLKAAIAKLPKTITTESTLWSEFEKKWFTKTEEVELKLRGGLGEGDPVFNDNEVWFNGDAETGNDGETCHIALDYPEKNLMGKYDWEYSFCKTERKPYDVAVCLTLLCFKESFGDDFKFRSEGNIKMGEEGWKLAKEIMEQLEIEFGGLHIL